MGGEEAKERKECLCRPSIHVLLDDVSSCAIGSRYDKVASHADRTVSRGVSVSTVTLNHVCKVYERGNVTVSVLRDADLHVASGEFCVIMGPSGSGKSTLLNVIAGLDTVTSGAIRLDDQPTDRFSDAEWTRYRRETIGMVFQAFHLVPGLTAAENVGLPLRLQKTSSAFIRQRVGETLEQVGVQHRAGHRPWELSGGEQHTRGPGSRPRPSTAHPVGG